MISIAFDIATGLELIDRGMRRGKNDKYKIK